ncbi:alpha-L-fucosidase [Haploplasma axanthum]|uniref:alpha-L-fucosidase n=1 Tax=Haploplasma axanthum TaxID=29552 RepID=A0A449BF97_HAPAX|nr:alpha-L-fucosidase [Haploplasma axanthum]VEU81111.1 Alpha-L-fucosidase [Haploplasma axanthum]
MYKKISEIEKVINEGPFKDTWESLQKKNIPSWFKNSKFGIFIHWGLYSVPAFNNEWYSRNMYIEGMEEFKHHIETYGAHKGFGYKDFIPMFKADKFDPSHWAKIIKKSGAKYVFPVAEHHDGFQMYKSDISKWNSYEMGPKKDILGELKNAFNNENLIFCTSTHRAEHWFFMSHGKKFESDIPQESRKGDFYWPSFEEKGAYDFQSEPKPSKEFLEDWLERTVEIIDKYDPKILYFDWWIQHEAFKPYLKKVAAYYYNNAFKNNKDVIIAYKHDAFVYGSGIVEIERGRFKELKHFPWQTETAIANNSWCYTNNLDYKTENDVLTLLIDVVSKNGNLLLNIGPKGDGSIPQYEEKMLENIGKWLEKNGEAIYESIPYLIFGEGSTIEIEGKFSEKKIEYKNDDFRFTANNGAVYVFVLNPRDTKRFNVKTLRKATEKTEGIFSSIKKVVLLETQKEVSFKHNEEFLTIELDKSYDNYPIVFKVEME